MTELDERVLPIENSSSEGRLAVSLIFKLLAGLHEIGKLDDEEVSKVAATLIPELGSDQERFRTWTLMEELIPGIKRPEDEKRG
jgi:hypothetical protein